MKISECLGDLVGKGERSKIFQHKYNKKRLIKVSIYKEEKEVLIFFFKNPSNRFVKVFRIEEQKRTLYAEVEKLSIVDFTFRIPKKNSKNGKTHFFESNFMNINYVNSPDKDEYIKNVKEKIDGRQVETVDDYYECLKELSSIGLSVFDAAWNMGKKNGKFICFDGEFI